MMDPICRLHPFLGRHRKVGDRAPAHQLRLVEPGAAATSSPGPPAATASTTPSWSASGTRTRTSPAATARDRVCAASLGKRPIHVALRLQCWRSLPGRAAGSAPAASSNDRQPRGDVDALTPSRCAGSTTATSRAAVRQRSPRRGPDGSNSRMPSGSAGRAEQLPAVRDCAAQGLHDDPLTGSGRANRTGWCRRGTRRHRAGSAGPDHPRQHGRGAPGGCRRPHRRRRGRAVRAGPWQTHAVDLDDAAGVPATVERVHSGLPMKPATKRLSGSS